MRVPNSNIKCSRCVQAPIVEDLTYALRECTVFSKLDLKSGYHRLAIDEASAKVSTFSTPYMGKLLTAKTCFWSKILSRCV